MSIEVTIKGQDKRHVYDILSRHIDQRIHELENRGLYYSETPRKLDETKLTPRVVAALATLRGLDEQHRLLKLKIDKARAAVEKALGTVGALGAKHDSKLRWNRFVVQETNEQVCERVEGNADVRREKIEKLRDMKDRMLVAMASDESLEPFVSEFRVIAGKRFTG